MAPSSSRNRRLPEGSLDVHKEFIFHQFIELDRTDHQVCELLQKECNFSISRPQLELRLRKWGFRKRITGPEWNFIHAQIYQLGGLSDSVRVRHWDKPVGDKQLSRTRKLHSSQSTAAAATCPEHITIETRTADGAWVVQVKSGERGIGVSSPTTASLGSTSSRRIVELFRPGIAQSFPRCLSGSQFINLAVSRELSPLARSISPVMNLNHTKLITDVRGLLTTTGQGVIGSSSVPSSPRPSPNFQVTAEGYRGLLRHTPTEVFFRALQQDGQNLIIRPARGSSTRVRISAMFQKHVSQLGSNETDPKPCTPGPVIITDPSCSDETAEDVLELASTCSGNYGPVFRSDATFNKRFPALLAYTLANNFAGVTKETAKKLHLALQDFPGLGVAMARLFKARNNTYCRAMAKTLLSAAVESSDQETIEALLDNHLVNIELPSCHGFTPIDRAAQLGDTNIVCSLLARGADPNRRMPKRSQNFSGLPSRGALHYLVLAWSQQGVFSLDEIRVGAVQSFLDAGVEIFPDTVHYLFRLDTDDAVELASNLLAFISPDGLIYLIGHNVLKDIAERLDDQLGLELTQRILTESHSLNEPCDKCTRRTLHLCGGLYRRLDEAGVAAVKYGKEELLRWLLSYAKNHQTFIVICNAALIYGSRKILDLVLPLIPRTGGYSWDGRNITSESDIQNPLHTTPYALAVLKQDKGLLDYFEGNGVLEEGNEYKEKAIIWCSAIIAAVTVGDIDRLERFSRPRNIAKRLLFGDVDLYGHILRFLLVALNSALKNRDEKASLLVLSICCQTRRSTSNLFLHQDHIENPLVHALSWRHEQLVGALCNLHSALGTSYPYDRVAAAADDDDDDNEHHSLKFLAAQWGHPRIMEVIHASRPWEMMRGWEQVILLAKGGMKLLDDLHSAGYIQTINFGAILRHAILHRHDGLVSEVLNRITSPTDHILAIAIKHDRQDILHDLLSKISQPSHAPAAKDFGYRSIEAAMNKQPVRLDILKALLTSPNINAAAPGFQTPLRCAINAMRAGNLQDLEVVRLILTSASNPARLVRQLIPKRDFKRVYCLSTPFLEAIEVQRTDLVQLLIEYGADVNQQACMGINRTPLQSAVETENLDLVDLLLQHGADPSLPPADVDGATALQLAAKAGNCEIAAKLFERGVDLHAAPSLVQGFGPLEGAAYNGRFDMLQYLWQVASYERRLFPQSQCEEAIDLARLMHHGACADQIEELMAEHPEYSLAVNEALIVETTESPESSSPEAPSDIEFMDIDVSAVSSEQMPVTSRMELHVHEGGPEPQVGSTVEGDRPAFTQPAGIYGNEGYQTAISYSPFDEEDIAGFSAALTPIFS